MKKEFLQLILTFFCVLAVNFVCAESYRCTATKLNIRETATASGNVIGQVAQDETVEIQSIDGEWGMVLVNGDTGYVNMNYLEQAQATSEEKHDLDEPWSDKQKAVFWLCFAIAVGIYAFAVVRVQRGMMVVINGWLDFGLLVFPWLVVFAHLCDTFYGHLIFGKYVLIALYIIAGVCLVISLALSVIANWGSPFDIIFSLIMKLIVIPIMAFGVFYLLFKLGDKQGLNRRSIIIFAVLGVLIGGLMSFEE